jgi:hypothetical protein
VGSPYVPPQQQQQQQQQYGAAPLPPSQQQSGGGGMFGPGGPFGGGAAAQQSGGAFGGGFASQQLQSPKQLRHVSPPSSPASTSTASPSMGSLASPLGGLGTPSFGSASGGVWGSSTSISAQDSAAKMSNSFLGGLDAADLGSAFPGGGAFKLGGGSGGAGGGNGGGSGGSGGSSPWRGGATSVDAGAGGGAAQSSWLSSSFGVETSVPGFGGALGDGAATAPSARLGHLVGAPAQQPLARASVQAAVLAPAPAQPPQRRRRGQRGQHSPPSPPGAFKQQLQQQQRRLSPATSPQQLEGGGAAAHAGRSQMSTDSIVSKIVQLIAQNGGRIRGSNLGSLLASESGSMCVRSSFLFCFIFVCSFRRRVRRFTLRASTFILPPHPHPHPHPPLLPRFAWI